MGNRITIVRSSVIIGSMVFFIGLWGAVRAAPPSPEQDVWNTDPTEMKEYNCYNYAVNKKTPGSDGKPRKANPGKGKKWPDLGKDKTTQELCDTGRQRAKDDGLHEVTWQDGQPIPTPPQGENLVAYMAKAGKKGQGGDVHWWRKNSDGSWSHKPGSRAATASYKDSNGQIKPLSDPRVQAQRGGYELCGFMSIAKNSPPDIGPIALANPCRGTNEAVVLVSVENSSVPDPETVISDTSDINQLAARVPSLSVGNEVPNPHWEAELPGNGPAGYLVLSDPLAAPTMPVFMRIWNAVVEIPTGIPAEPYKYYNDNNDLETLVMSLFSPVYGACCVSNGSCVLTTGCTCIELGSGYSGDEVPCSPSIMCQADVPVVSEWSLAVLTLLGVIVGTITFRRMSA